ncbi:PAS/PAC sensor hybrid histidine kinase, partial [Paramagnetospirillum caucaseum]
VLFSFGEDVVAYRDIADGIISTLLAAGATRDQVFFERLDLVRFGTPEYKEQLAALIDGKFSRKNISLILTIHRPALDFVLEDGRGTLSKKPVIAAMLRPEEARQITSPRVTHLPYQVDYRGTLELGLQLLPQTRRVVMVTGASPADKSLEVEARAAFEPWKDKLDFEFTSELSLPEIMGRVAALPPRTMVLASTVYADSTGTSRSPVNVVHQVAARANAPVFTMWDSVMARGIVGGRTVGFQSIGQHLAKLALDRLAGGSLPAGAPPLLAPPSRTRLDWREIIRWEIDTRHLPPDAVLENRPPSLWDEHRQAVIFTATAFMTLATMAFALLVMNRNLKQAKAEAGASEERFRDLVTTTPDLISRVDAEGTILYVNHAIHSVFGFAPEQCVGRSAFDFVHPDDRGKTQAAFEDWNVSGAVSVAFENRMLDADGGSHHMSWNICLRRDELGEIIDITSVARDVSERKRVEEELLRHKNHLEELVQEQMQSVMLLLRKAEEANSAKSTFLANMSHELRTPLTSVIGFSQLMAEDMTLTEGQRRKLSTINRSGNHLLTLINDVLELSKIEAGGMHLEVRPTNIGDLIESVVEMMRPRAEHKGLQLTVRTSDLPAGIAADATKLRQVLLNLLSNAVKFTERGRIGLEVAATDADPGKVRLDVAVSDSGIGISGEDQARIFEPFVQAGAANSHAGTGLGLGISRQYVRMMGGDLAVESWPKLGSLFRFSLVFETCAVPAEACTPAGKVVGLEAGADAPRILVAEDNADIRVLLKTLLVPLGFTVMEAPDGAEAVAAVQSDSPDLIIMDWRMPVMDGVEATRRIRALTGIRQPRIVILTASAFEEQRLITLAAGADDFLRKPFEPDDLLALLERQLAVRFRRKESVWTPPQAAAALTPADVAALSAPVRGALAAAVQELSQAKLAEALASVALEHPDIASRVKGLMDGAKFRELWSMLEGGSQ